MKLKIYVCYHKDFNVNIIDHLYQIQVGTAINKYRLPNKVYDNTGDNISYLNKYYCELTALYWIWKNEISDYYGLFHYRRYLIFDEEKINDYKGKQYSIPYECLKYPDDKTLKYLGYEDGKHIEIIDKYDIIMPIAEDMHISVYNHYVNAPHHKKQDIDLICEIITEKFPKYRYAMKKYLNNSICYFGNIFIANNKIFNDYCKWLFSILYMYDQMKNINGYNEQELRVNGYLAERLLGIYFTWLKDNSNVRWAEVPRVHFEYMGNKKHVYYTKKILNFMLPPGSKRRMIIKKYRNK